MPRACAILSSVTCPPLQYLSKLPHKCQDFRKLLNIKCMFLFSLQHQFYIFLILRRTEQDITKNVYWSSTRYSCQILMKLEFPRQSFKNNQISDFTKIRPVGAELFHEDRTDGRTDGQTDMADRMVAFRNFSYAPKNDTFGHRYLTQRHLIANTLQ